MNIEEITLDTCTCMSSNYKLEWMHTLSECHRGLDQFDYAAKAYMLTRYRGPDKHCILMVSSLLYSLLFWYLIFKAVGTLNL